MSRRRLEIVSGSGGAALRSSLSGLTLALGLLVTACEPPLTEVPASGGEAPELLAVFDLTRHERGRPADPRRSFRLWREKDRIVYATEGETTVRMWRRTAHGDISHFEAWPGRKVAVEYVPGDLRALGAMPVWEGLQGLVERDLLATSLHQRGTGRHRGMRVTRYAGSVEGTELELTWIPSLRLPAELEEVRDGGTSRLELRQVYRLQEAPWRPPDLRSMRTIDFADLGDTPPGLVPRPTHRHGGP